MLVTGATLPPLVGVSVGAWEGDNLCAVAVAGERVVASVQGCVERFGQRQVAGVVGAGSFRMTVRARRTERTSTSSRCGA